MISHIRNSD